MSTVYRAYSPSRDDTHGLTDDRAEMTGVVAILNQGAALGIHPPDWTIQAGTIQWEQP